MELSQKEFQRIFPHAQNISPRVPALEQWLKQSYEPVTPALNVSGYALWRRPTASSLTSLVH
jgi:hypothetical protein